MTDAATPTAGDAAAPDDDARDARRRWLDRGKTALIVTSFALMLWAIDGLARSINLADVGHAITSTPVVVLAMAIGFLALQYTGLMVREWVAARYADRADLGWKRPALAGAIASMLSSLGIATLTGLGLRLRIYGRWGVTTGEVGLMTGFNSATNLIGLVAQAALVGALLPLPGPVVEVVGATLPRLIGMAAAAGLTTYVVACLRGPRALKLGRWSLPVPSRKALLVQLVQPLADLACGAAIVWSCLPAAIPLDYLDVVTMVFAGSVVGAVTQVPGGIGVLETVALFFVDDARLHPSLLAALLVRRMLTTLLPIVVGAGLLAGFEVLDRKRNVGLERPGLDEDLLADVAASVLAVTTFAVGIIGLVLAMLPTRDVALSADLFRVAVGVATLAIAHGLERRKRVAYVAAIGLVISRVVIGVIADPTLLGVLLAGTSLAFLIIAWPVFRNPRARRAARGSWWIAIALAVGGLLWLGYFSHGHLAPSLFKARAAMLLIMIALGVGLVVGSMIWRRHKRRRDLAAARPRD